ncbi:MAG TPA: hypothetical protein VJ957_02805, partial [Longimicrobiales bacterium]|nr:hypothetical protein [Longimicrobiales bacterium]
EELLQRQMNALAAGGWRRVHDWQAMPDEKQRFRRDDIGTATLAEYGRMRKLLAGGDPVLLHLVRVGGPFANPTENHQVLAWACQEDRKEGRARIRIYDPNRPGEDEVYLEMGLRHEDGRVPVRQSGGEPARGFFVVEYDRPRPLRFRAETYADRSPLGFNHPLSGQPAVVRQGGRYDVFVRDQNADVIRLSRDSKGRWEAQNLTAAEQAGIEYRLAMDPVAAVDAAGRLVVFGRTNVGDVVCYARSRRGRWSGANLTLRKRTGVDFRIAGVPASAAGPGGRTWLLGRNREGHLIQYLRRPLTGWTAQNVTRSQSIKGRYTMASDPVVLRGPGDALHAFALNERGDLLHYFWRKRSGWAAENLTERQRPAESLRLVGRPAVLHAPHSTQAVLGRNARGELVYYHCTPSTAWKAENVTRIAKPALTPDPRDAPADAPDTATPATPATEPADAGTRGDTQRTRDVRIAGDPTASIAPDGSLHVLGRNEQGGIVHYARTRTAWVAEDLTSERPVIDTGLRSGGDPAMAFSPGPRQHVFARDSRDLLLYHWSPLPSWAAENLTMERANIGARFCIACDPVLVPDAQALPHVFAVDLDGRLVHYYAV